MTKRILALVLSVLMTFTMFTAVAASETNGRVEITFCVGDEILTINGEAVKVEKPYVVGEGVTLVPLRVITEAFGAEVGWEDATRTVTLKYPDVNIVLQIGNPIAEVNGKSETLLAAPELPGESTMVPLRFISENFGALVSYEEATERITVVKENKEGDSSTVESAVESKYIGDSYYLWTMENPKDMSMVDRSFDGTYTSFAHGEDNYINIYIYAMDDEYNFEKSYADWKERVKKYTLIKANKNSDQSSKMIIHIQAKDKTYFYEGYEIATNKYVYIVMGRYKNADTAIKNECTRLVSTFDSTFEKADTYDLSNVKNGVRRFEAETVKLSFDVPASYVVSEEELENSFVFVNNLGNDVDSKIKVEVYSKDSVGGADALANEDFTRNRDVLNNEVVKFDKALVRNTYGPIKTHEYNYEVNVTGRNDYNRDMFFEIGEYVYNVHMCIKLPNENTEGIIRAFMNSIKAEKINFEEVGTLMRNDPDSYGTYSSEELLGCKIEFPNDFEEIAATQKNIVYSDGVILFYGYVYTDNSYTLEGLKSAARNMANDQRSAGNEIVSDVESITIGNKRYVKFCSKKEINDVAAYVETYFTEYLGRAYIFEAVYPEIGYSNSARGEVDEIISSMIYN